MVKTNFVKSCLAVLAIVLQSGCGNNSNNGVNGYYLNNGQCYSSMNGQIVPPNYCGASGAVNGGYYQSNGLCYASNGQNVPLNYCSGTGANYCSAQPGQLANNTYCNNGQMGASTVCVGTYYQYGGSSAQTINCNGSNCSGLSLYNSAGAQVYCQ